ncbi:SLATT domain-containing protein [candidate division KSB1 bacterium]|nr:SLATT domain-containing protein [candidate division KSB1 bacterium]
MHDILAKATEYRNLTVLRAIAHEKSAAWHRRRGALLGVMATILSGMVGTTIFATITSQLGLDGKGSISLPQGGWALVIYLVVGFLLILSPVLSGVQTYLNHPDQAAKHKFSWIGYYHLQQQLDIFLLRYTDGNTATTNREGALQELEDISKEIETICENSITLTKLAYTNAEKELKKKTPKQNDEKEGSTAA